MNEVLDFIKRRFPNDCNWMDGNCFYFAKILNIRFGGTIWYDTIYGHFVIKIDDVMYDWQGVVDDNKKHNYVYWNRFDNYDTTQQQRIIRDCIM